MKETGFEVDETVIFAAPVALATVPFDAGEDAIGFTVSVMSLMTVEEIVVVEVEGLATPAATEVAVGVGVGVGISPSDMASETGHTVV